MLFRHDPGSGSKRAKPGLIALIWPFAAVVAIQLLVAVVSLYTMSAVRAYVGGESLWSKSQKEAIYYLHLYADSGNEAFFRRYEEAIAVPLGDREARLALERGEPGAALGGFAAGGNHPADVPGMIWLYQNFRHVSYLAQSIDYWTQADAFILELDQLARSLHQQIEGGTADPVRLEHSISEIDRISGRIAPLALNFSMSLGEGSRMIKNVLMAANVFTAALLILLAVWRTAKHLEQNRAFERALRSEKERIQSRSPRSATR